MLLLPDPGDFTRDPLFVDVLFTPDNYQDDLCVAVEIVDDSVYEEEIEYLEVRLSTEDACVDFKEQSILLGIADNDCKSDVHVSPKTYSRRTMSVVSEC